MYTVFVSDLHPDVTEELLTRTLSPAGQIHSIRLCRDISSGSSGGSAYVNFWCRADAEKAIETFNYEYLLGWPIRLMWSQWDGSVRGPATNTNLVVKNLDKSINNMDLYNTFSCFGEVLSCNVVCDETGSTGYGSVQFDSEEAAEMAMVRLNGKLLNNRQVIIERFMSCEEQEAEMGLPTSCLMHQQVHISHVQNGQGQTTLNHKIESLNLYVKNLDDFVDDECLRSAFGQFGTIISSKVMMKNGQSRGFGFVCFSSSQEAKKAIRVMNGKMWGRKRVYVGVALRKEERRAIIEHQHKQKVELMQCNSQDSTIPQAQNLNEPYPHLHWISWSVAEAVLAENSVPGLEAVPSIDKTQNQNKYFRYNGSKKRKKNKKRNH